jgi:hypothetical protein
MAKLSYARRRTLEEYLQMGGAIQRNDPESGLDWLVTTILPAFAPVGTSGVTSESDFTVR